jgi:hypothetical protein
MNKSRIINAALIGLIASIIFILIQPIFGLSTLTSRHASAYVKFGQYSEFTAMLIAWFVHISVSIAYAQLSAFIFTINHSLKVNAVQVVFFGWLTTLIATPANEFVVKLVTTRSFPALDSLSGLNMEVGPKLWLHIVFFVFVMIGLVMTKDKFFNKHN